MQPNWTGKVQLFLTSFSLSYKTYVGLNAWEQTWTLDILGFFWLSSEKIA